MRAFLAELFGVPPQRAEREACLMEHDVSAETTERVLNLIKLMRTDGILRKMFQQRFATFRRECRPSDSCSTCGLACVAVLNPPA